MELYILYILFKEEGWDGLLWYIIQYFLEIIEGGFELDSYRRIARIGGWITRGKFREAFWEDKE
jgi:hypothetical protein